MKLTTKMPKHDDSSIENSRNISQIVNSRAELQDDDQLPQVEEEMTVGEIRAM